MEPGRVGNVFLLPPHIGGYFYLFGVFSETAFFVISGIQSFSFGRLCQRFGVELCQMMHH
jgi:hypothetical protein